MIPPTTVDLLTATDVLALLDRHAVRLRHHLGQNFVVDPNTIRRIVSLAALVGDEHVLEIGPGFGSLTLGLLGASARVTAVEISADVAAVLDEVVRARAPALADRLDLRIGDAAAMDLSALAPDATVLVANLPYGPATSIVLDVLVDAPRVERLVVMVQREVAERLVAEPGTAAYGLPSLRRAMNATARILGSVSAEVFLPKPRVASAIIEIRRLETWVPFDEQRRIMDLARPAFEQRRKMVRASLRGRVTTEAFTGAGVDPASRPEALDLSQWRRLAEAVNVGSDDGPTSG